MLHLSIKQINGRIQVCQKEKRASIKFVEDFLSNHKEIEEELCRQMGRPLSQCAGNARL